MGNKRIYLAGGCFWGLEEYMSRIRGVRETSVGYANGQTTAPAYEEVCSGVTGHAETTEVVYDPEELPLSRLLAAFFEVIDPTSLYRQGNDRGTQYRTGIYYSDETDLPAIREAVEERQRQYARPIVTEVEPLRGYWPAEDYHQRYLKKNPHGYCHIDVSKAEAFCASAKTGAEAEEENRGAAPDALCDGELRSRLTPMQYRVTRENATEPPFDNAYFDFFQDGIYVDVVTGEPLFSSAEKFDSGCGWPAFAKPLEPKAVNEREDRSFGMVRREVRSQGGDSHLGHVFEDGPDDRGGLRYCINSAAVRFVPYEEMEGEGYGELKSAVRRPGGGNQVSR